MEGGGHEALGEGEGADWGGESARREEDGGEGAEEEVGFGLGELGEDLVARGDGVTPEVGGFLEGGAQGQREDEGVEGRDELAEVDVERLACEEERERGQRPSEGPN